jgi:hypothetical protein
MLRPPPLSNRGFSDLSLVCHKFMPYHSPQHTILPCQRDLDHLHVIEVFVDLFQAFCYFMPYHFLQHGTRLCQTDRNRHRLLILILTLILLIDKQVPLLNCF